jgi:hypothetical protein
MLGDEKAKFDQPQHDDQNAAAQAIDECVDERLSLHARDSFTQRRKGSQRRLCANFAPLRETNS